MAENKSQALNDPLASLTFQALAVGAALSCLLLLLELEATIPAESSLKPPHGFTAVGGFLFVCGATVGFQILFLRAGLSDWIGRNAAFPLFPAICFVVGWWLNGAMAQPDPERHTQKAVAVACLHSFNCVRTAQKLDTSVNMEIYLKSQMLKPD